MRLDNWLPVRRWQGAGPLLWSLCALSINFFAPPEFLQSYIKRVMGIFIFNLCSSTGKNDRHAAPFSVLVNGNSTEKGAACRSFFPVLEQRLKMKIPVTPEFSGIVTGHGKTKS